MALITIDDLTTGTVNGTGVFDQLMQTVKAQLQEEYQANRIRGTDYASVYTNAIAAVLQQSMAFLMGQQQADKQAELLAAQIAQTEQQTLLLAAQTALTQQQAANALTENATLLKQQAKLDAEIIVTTNQGQLIAQQKTNAVLEGNILGSQKLKVDGEIALQAAQTGKVIADTALTEQETANALTNNAFMLVQQAKLQQDILLATQQTNLVQQQTANALSEKDNIVATKAKIIAETGLTTANTTLTNTNNSVQLKQIDKATTEIAVLNQRKISEEAQTVGTVTLDGSGNPIPSIGGVLGRQMALYYAQTSGFKRDAEYKLAKAMMDVWSVKRTTDEGLAADPAGLGDASISAVVSKAKSGIGV